MATSNINSIADSNQSRLSRNQAFVAGFYFVIEFGLLCLAILAAIWQTWLWKGCSCCEERSYCRAQPFLIWSLIFFGFQQLVCWTGGFLGWIFISTLLAVHCLLIWSLYMSFNCRCCNICCSRLAICLRCPEACLTALEIEDPQPKWGTKTNSQEEKTIESIPEPLSWYQRRGLYLFLGLFILSFILCIIVWFSWNVEDYLVWDRIANEAVVEFQPQYISRAVAVVYAYPHLATDLRFNIVHKEQTRTCGIEYNKRLSNSEKYQAIEVDYIELYSINMTIFENKNYMNYSTVNDWFIRQLDPSDTVSLRPIASPFDDSVLISPADARLVVFPSITNDLQFWIKGDSFSVTDFLNANNIETQAFLGGSMAIVRLAPQDYHRFHAPVSGEIKNEYYVSGTIFSVNADAMRSDNGAIYNQRVVTYIDTQGYSDIGDVAFVSIGAACVGSIFMSHDVGAVVQKGTQMGYFQFGGSTVVLLFQPGKVVWANDILIRSQKQVESFVRMGQQIGSLT